MVRFGSVRLGIGMQKGRMSEPGTFSNTLENLGRLWRIH